jgi:hypothetical protein
LADRATICRKVLIVKLLQSKTDRMPWVAVRYAMVLVFGVSLLLLSSIEFLDAIAIVSVVAIQVFLGGLIWRKIRGSAPIEVAEFLGMGGAVGFSLAIISSQIFRETLPRSIAWLVLLLAGYGLCIFVKSASVGDATPIAETENKSKPEYPLLVIFCGTLVALSTSWYWLIPTALVCTGAIVWLLLRETIRSFGAKSYLVYKVALLPLGFYALQVLIDLTRVETIRNPNWWSLRLGIYEDPDLIFNESLIQSIQKFGISDNIFFSGYPLKYHWLSFAWESTLDSFRDVQPFSISGIAGPVVTYFSIMCMVFALTKYISSNRFAPAASVAIVSMASSDPIPLFRMLNPNSFSYNFSLHFVLAALFLLACFRFELKRTAIAILSLLVFISVGSKISSAAGFLLGLLPMLVFALLRRSYLRQIIQIGLGTMLAICLFWLFGYRQGHGSTTAGVQIDFGELFIQKANYSWSEPLFILAFGFIATAAAILFPVSGLLMLKGVCKSDRKNWIQFVLFSGLGVSLLSFLVADEAESSNYLLGLGLTMLLPLSVGSISDYWSRNKIASLRLIVFPVVGGILASVIWNDLYDRINPRTDNSQLNQSIVVLVPLFVAILLAVVVFKCYTVGRVAKSFGVFVICLSVSGTGNYIAHSNEFYNTGISNRVGSDSVAAPYTGSPEYRALLSWLKSNSSESDLVATNRQCLEVKTDLENCLPLWSLTSALTGRQNLVEGLWPSFTQDSLDERKKRWKSVTEFVENPSEENRDLLIEYGVKWVVADHAITSTRDWQPFATERYKNLAGSILELNP